MRAVFPGKDDPTRRGAWRRLFSSSWLWISLLAILAAGILRLSFDLSGVWRTAYQAAFLGEHLHASSEADYSTDTFLGFIPAIRPGILNDLADVILPELGNRGPALAVPLSPTPSPTATRVGPAVPPALIGTTTPTSHASEPTASLMPGQPSPTLRPTSTAAPALTSTPTRTPQTGESPTPRTPTPTRIASITPVTPRPTTAVPAPTTEVPSPTTPAPPPTTAVPPPTTAVPAPTTAVPAPTTAVPAPTTPVPPATTPPGATPFATRDPTRVVTPTAVYTPGGTSAPVTAAPGGQSTGSPSSGSLPASSPWIDWLGALLRRLGV